MASGAVAYANYLVQEALKQDREAVARYYANERAPQQELSLVDELGLEIHRGNVSFGEALDELMRVALQDAPDLDIDAVDLRLSNELNAAWTRADYAEEIAAKGNDTGVRLRPDLSHEFAKRLGIDPTRPLAIAEMANLMNLRTADGAEIEGKKRHSPHRSVASVFGLNPREMPSVEQVWNVLNGRRADGGLPCHENANKRPLKPEIVDSSLRAFKAAIGVPNTRDATQEEIERVAAGQIDRTDYRRKINGTYPPVGYLDLTFSADKSVSIAYAHAPTKTERDIILGCVQDATVTAMGYVQQEMGLARRGAGGADTPVPAEIAWLMNQHYSARPATDIIRHDAQGREYTDTRTIPGQTADPNLHQHVIVLASILGEDGKVGSLDLSRLEGRVKVFGKVFHAALATNLREYGVDARLGPEGEARIQGIPDWFRKFSSRRSMQGEEVAKKWATEQGKDWSTLSGDERAAMIDSGMRKAREDKLNLDQDKGPSQIAEWQQEAQAAGYQHRSVLRPDQIGPELTQERRLEIALEVTRPILDDAFRRSAVLIEGEVLEIAGWGLIASGIGPRPADDLAAVLNGYRDRGITVDGQETNLVRAMTYDNGRPRTVYTTGHTEAQERELAELVCQGAGDRERALSTAAIDQAAERFLASHPRVDRDSVQWQSQLDMAHRLGEGGDFALAVGVAGSGKTSAVVATLVDAWHADGKIVYGLTVPWRATEPLKDAGVDHAVAIDAFLKRVEKGQYKLDRNTVIVADEVSMIGVRQQIAILRLASEYGARVVEIGDPRQCKAVETPAIDIMARAIGDDQIPKLLTSLRQATERGREVAGMFRDGRADEGVAAMLDDGKVHLVAGGADYTIQRTVTEWRRLTDAHANDPDYSVAVMAPTNARVQDIGKAIQADRRAAGELGAVERVVKATDGRGAAYDLELARGDVVRLFSRTFDADTPNRRKWLGDNGHVVTVTEVLADGLRVRNADRIEGRIADKQMRPWRAPRNEPVRLGLGYATTIDSAQSLTRTAAILSLPDGSRHVTGYKAYTALSRHVDEVHLVVSDAAERQAVIKRQMLGAKEAPSRQDVIRNIGTNLSRFSAREQATEAVRRASEIVRGTVASRIRTREDTPQEPAIPLPDYQRQRMDLSPTIQRTLEMARQIPQQAMEMAHQLRRGVERYYGPTL